MAPQPVKSFIKRASFRRKKNTEPKAEKTKDLNEEDEAKFIEFKKKVDDEIQEWHSDVIMLRFLKARSFDVEEAAKLFRLDVNCRRMLNAVRLLSDYEIPEVIAKYHSSGVIGFDKEGSLVRILNLGHTDFKGIIHSLSTVEQLKIFMWYMEHDAKMLKDENKKTGREVDRFSYIINLENISMSQLMYKPVLDTGLLGLKLLQDHFHDIAKVVYIINAPPYFPSLYKLFKPAIQEHLHKKLKIFSTEGWREELANNIDPDQLPVFLGGRRVDCNNDPLCKAIIGFGGIVPESYYSGEGTALDPEDPFVITATIPAGSFLNFRYPVTIVGTELCLHLQSKDNDIGMAIYFEPLASGLETPRTQQKKKKEEDMTKLEPLCPVIRTQCQITPEISKTTAWKVGTYIIHFDNTYSWMNAKQVYFKVTVVPPASSPLQLSAASISFQTLAITTQN